MKKALPVLLFSIASALAACAESTSDTTAQQQPIEKVEVAAKEVMIEKESMSHTDQAIITQGSFSGLSDHITLGGAKITGTQGAYTLVFDADFSLDGAPDPIVGFGNNGTFDISTKLGSLTNKDGAQSYPLPVNFDPATAGEVYVWCEKFSVPLGVASLTK